MAEKLGDVGQNWRELLPYIEKPTFLMAFILPILIGVVILLIPPVTEVLLPQYIPGVAAAQISIITVYFLGLMGMYAIFLGTSLRLLPYGVVTVTGIILNIAGSYFSVRFGWGLVGLAWAKVIAYGMVAILLFCYVEKLFNRKWQELFLRMAILLAPMIVVYLLTFWIIPWLVPSSALSNSEMLHKTSYQVIILIIFTSPLVLFALRICRVVEDVIVSIRRVFPQFSRIRQL
jgi:hypothetical protein